MSNGVIPDEVYSVTYSNGGEGFPAGEYTFDWQMAGEGACSLKTLTYQLDSDSEVIYSLLPADLETGTVSFTSPSGFTSAYSAYGGDACIDVGTNKSNAGVTVMNATIMEYV